MARAICAPFSDRDECATVEATKRFLSTAACEDDAEILDKLEHWAMELVDNAIGGRGSLIVGTSTAEDLAIRLERYTVEPSQPSDEERSPDGPSLWPLVSLVTCHFDNVFSKQGISFLDAAGSGDHRLRTDISLELRRQCLYSLVVVGSARAANDPSVPKLVHEAKNKSDGRLIVVVTSSDVIDDSIVGGTSIDRENLTDIQELIAQKQLELADITAQKSKAKDKARRFELAEAREDLQARMKVLKDHEKALRIEMRSGDTQARLQEKLKDITGSRRTIPVISVSNKLYEAYQTELSREEAPELSVEQTNIPTLRRAICKFPNTARMQEMSELVFHAAPALLEKARMLL